MCVVMVVDGTFQTLLTTHSFTSFRLKLLCVHNNNVLCNIHGKHIFQRKLAYRERKRERKGERETTKGRGEREREGERKRAIAKRKGREAKM